MGSPSLPEEVTKLSEGFTEIIETSSDLEWTNLWSLHFVGESGDNNDTFNPNVTNATLDCGAGFQEGSFLSSAYFQAIVSFLYFGIFCVALLGNGLVCFIVRVTPRMRTVTNYFIANLALGDILMSLFCVPFSFMSQLVLNHWPFGVTLCRLVNYSQAVSVLVSAYTLVALAADRCRAITSPLRPRLSKPAAQAAIAAVWVGALATAAPIPIVSSLAYPTPWHEACQRSICREEWPHPEQSYYYSMALMALQFVVPLVVLVSTYTRIAIAVWGERPPGEAENLRDTRMAQSKRKMVKMMVVVVAVFTMCWLPLNTLVVLMDESWERWSPLPYVWFAFHWLAMSHSCYNPIIYCYMNARFRVGFLQVLSKVPCCTSYVKARFSYGETINRSSAGNIPMTGVETTDQLLFRMNTGSTYVSVRRNTSQNSFRPSLLPGPPLKATAPGARAHCLNGQQNRV